MSESVGCFIPCKPLLFTLLVPFFVQTPSILRSFCSYLVCCSPLFKYFCFLSKFGHLIVYSLFQVAYMLNSTAPTTQTSDCFFHVSCLLYMLYSYTLSVLLISKPLEKNFLNVCWKFKSTVTLK